MRSVFFAVVCAGLCVGMTNAQAPAEADLNLNDLMALRAKVMIEAHQLQMEIRQMWNDPACTSPEIEALRKKIEELQEAFRRTQAEIGAKVEALPEVREKVKRVEEANKKIEELNQKIEKKQGAG